MEGIIMIVSFAAGIAAAFFIGVRIGRDQGFSKGMEEATEALQEIQKQGDEEIKRIEKAINTDCPWK